jgi:leader peptidase (prepilin peptidase)/N-methyltransferase
VITGPAALAAIAAVGFAEPAKLPGHLLAGAIAAGAFFLVVLAYPRGMGMGDVKLAGVLGLFLGPAVAPALLVATATGSVTGIVIAARRGIQVARSTAIPFGPFLAVGGVAGLFAGAQLVSWYLSTFG